MVASIDTDYLIVGCGAVGVAFADTILTETDATVTIVDRRARPGGHWNDAYSFVQLHQPSALYGVNSIPLGDGQKDSSGLNKGYCELARGPEVLDYFDKVVNTHFLSTGRVKYYPQCDYLGDGKFNCSQSGTTMQVNVRRKIVDATFYGTTVPLTHTPSFEVADGVKLVAPNALPGLWRTDATKPEKLVILGAGKTAMDVGVWLLNAGVEPQAISWVMPRDSWLLNRQHTQPGAEFFHETFGGQVAQMEALATATDLPDLFRRLETSGVMLRIDRDTEPSMYHCATMSQGEVDLLRKIKNVIRKGRVQSIDTSGMVLGQGRVAVDGPVLYVDCTATAIERRPPVPVFQDNLITLQMIRACQPTFSAALTAHLEATLEDEGQKNQLSGPVPLPEGLPEFLTGMLMNMINQFQWSRDPGIRQWMIDSRLDGFSAVIAEISKDDTEKQAVLKAFRGFARQAPENINRLIAQQNADLVLSA